MTHGPNNNENHGSIKKLPCDHIFHKSCLRSWFQRQQTCPTCRYIKIDIIFKMIYHIH